MSLPAIRPLLPHGCLTREIVERVRRQCMQRPTVGRRMSALTDLIRELADRIEENEAIIARGSPPGDGPKRLDE